MKMDELRQLGADELEHKLEVLKKELFKLRFQAKCAKLEKPSRIGQVKRDIARILTLKREKRKANEPTKATEGATGEARARS